MSRKKNRATDAAPADARAVTAGAGSASGGARAAGGRLVIALCVGLALAIGAVFGQTLRHDFVTYDDVNFIVENPQVANGLTFEGLRWALSFNQVDEWRPLSWLSHMLDAQLYGLWPGGHHLTSVLIHAASACLLFLFLRRVTAAFWASAFAAAVFAVHPLRVEVVAWAAERKEALALFFGMLALLAYARAVERPTSWGRRLAVIAALALSLMSKSMLVTLPFVLLLLDYWPLGRCRFGPPPATCPPGLGDDPRGRPTIARLILEKAPLFAMAAASTAIAFVSTSQMEALAPTAEIPLVWRIDNALVSCVLYLKSFFWPDRLAFLYPHPRGSLSGWLVASCAATLIALTAIALLQARRRPYLIVGWLWYLGALAPVIGLVQGGEQARADRYTYFSQLGLTLAVVWAVAGSPAWRRLPRAVRIAAPALALAALAVAAALQTRHWRDSETLYRRALAVTSDNAVAHNNLAVILEQRGELDAALDHYRQAVALRPRYANALNNIGAICESQGQEDAAFEYYRKAVESQPRYAQARHNLGLLALKRGQLELAAECFAVAADKRPDWADAHNNLGVALLKLGLPGEALAPLRAAERLEPDDCEILANLAAALEQLGATDEATARYRQALAHDPRCFDALCGLAAIAVAQGRPAEAVELARQAIAARPGAALGHCRLGDALLVLGRHADAAAAFAEATRLEPDNPEYRRRYGAALTREGQIAAAAEQFACAVRLRPDWAEARADYGTLLRELGQLDQALEQFGAALRLNPGLFDAHSNLAQTLVKAGRTDEAISHFRRALELNPNYVRGYLLLGAALRARGDRAQAAEQLRAGLRLAEASGQHDLSQAIARDLAQDEEGNSKE